MHKQQNTIRYNSTTVSYDIDNTKVTTMIRRQKVANHCTRRQHLPFTIVLWSSEVGGIQLNKSFRACEAALCFAAFLLGPVP